MKPEILNRYNVVFYKNIKGEKLIDCGNKISAYLYIWRNINSIDDFLSDIDLCITNQFNLVEDPDYSDSLLNLYGELASDSIKISEANSEYGVVVPLHDFKELLLCWKEFLLQ
jgi:hypothetical protein